MQNFLWVVFLNREITQPLEYFKDKHPLYSISPSFIFKNTKKNTKKKAKTSNLSFPLLSDCWCKSRSCVVFCRSHRSLMSFEYAQFHSEWFEDHRPLYSSHVSNHSLFHIFKKPESPEVGLPKSWIFMHFLYIWISRFWICKNLIGW